MADTCTLLYTLLHCCSPSIAVANTKAKHVMNPCEELLPYSKMPCTASVSILEAKEIQNLSWLLETMKIRWDYLVINCATLNCCNKTDWQCIKGTVLKWDLERCLGPSQDYMTCPFFWNPPGFKLHKSMLLSSPALLLTYTVKTIKWKSKNIQQEETSGSTWIYKANFTIFPISLVYCLSNIRTRKAWIHWLNIPLFSTFFNITQ